MALKRTFINGIVNRIRLVGVELEGAWKAVPPGEGEDHEGIERDGSVEFGSGHPLLVPHMSLEAIANIPNLMAQLGQVSARNVGEIVQHKPMPPGSPELEEWIRRCYPQFVNATCGLHVHMSFFNRLNYQRLMTQEYTTQMVASLLRWAEQERLPDGHPLWPRLRTPNHRHCAHIYLGDGQVRINRKDYNSRGTEHSRYTAINYCDKQHGTVECRLLSMMADADQGIRAINAVIDTTNRFLSKFREREVRVKASVPQRSEVFMSFPGNV